MKLHTQYINVMKINVDKTTLRLSRNNVITGIISIVVDTDKFFPEQYWNDSIIIVLDNWLRNMNGLLRGTYNEGVFVFFDGPFSFKIKKSEDIFSIIFFHQRKVLEIYKINIYQFGYQLAEASRNILFQTNKKGWKSHELTNLQSSLEILLSFFHYQG